MASLRSAKPFFQAIAVDTDSCHRYSAEPQAVVWEFSDGSVVALVTGNNEDEIEELNRIVVMWLDYAEDQAKRRKQVFLKDWQVKLDEFLHFNDRAVLPDSGAVSKKEADAQAADSSP